MSFEARTDLHMLYVCAKNCVLNGSLSFLLLENLSEPSVVNAILLFADRCIPVKRSRAFLIKRYSVMPSNTVAIRSKLHIFLTGLKINADSRKI